VPLDVTAREQIHGGRLRWPLRPLREVPTDRLVRTSHIGTFGLIRW